MQVSSSCIVHESNHFHSLFGSSKDAIERVLDTTKKGNVKYAHMKIDMSDVQDSRKQNH